VLFIHGDDDRNVYFTQTVDLAARLRERGVEIEQLVFPTKCMIFCFTGIGWRHIARQAISLIAISRILKNDVPSICN